MFVLSIHVGVAARRWRCHWQPIWLAWRCAAEYEEALMPRCSSLCALPRSHSQLLIHDVHLFDISYCLWASSASLSRCRMGLVWNTPAGFRKTGSWNEALEAVRSHRLCCQRGVRCAFCMNHRGEPYFHLAASAQLLSLRQRRQCRCTVVIGKWDYDHVTF